MGFIHKSRILLLMAVLLLAGCGDGNGSSTEPPEPEPAATSLTLAASGDTLDALGATLAIQAQVRDQFGQVMTSAPTPNWTSSRNDVATVSGGVVTAVDNGSAQITATSGGISESVQVWVVQRPAEIVAVSGHGQSATAGSELDEPVVIRVEDANGSGVSGIAVGWTIRQGGGSLSETQQTSDEEGQASTRWTLGASGGAQELEVSVEGGPSTMVAATAALPPGSLTVQSISPSLLVEGETATLTGTGLADASVTVDDQAAQVLSSSAGSLTFQVPVGECLPTRPVPVQVSQGADAVVQSVPVSPRSTIEPFQFGTTWMSFGSGAKGHCLSLASRSTPATYLIGVQSISEVVSSVTPANLQISSASPLPAGVAALQSLREGVGDPGTQGLARRELDVTPVAAPLAAAPPVPGAALPMPSEEDQALAHAHARQMERNMELLRELGPSARTLDERPALASTALQNVGDQTTVRVPESCDAYTTINGTVRAVGNHAIWVEDNDRPSGGLSGGDYNALASLYDQLIGPELTRLLGPPTDLDQNGRVVIVLTPEVNDLETTNGFVFTGDFFPRSACDASNQGEYFYMVVPDPNGTTARELSVSQALDLYPRLLAHELTHVIHFGTQIFEAGATSLPEVWETEGLATFVEELVGHTATGNSSGQQLGRSAVQEHGQWYMSMFYDLAIYSGFESPTSRLAQAPHECSWLARPPGNGPCVDPGRLPYGVPASIFRWIADFAWSPQTEHQMTRAIASATTHGLPLLAELAGEETEWVLALWAMAVMADGKYFGSGSPTFASWNFHDVFSGFHATAHPTPMTTTYDSSVAFNLRGGSMAYFLVQGTHDEIAVAAPDLSSNVRLWMVRVE